MNKLIYFFSALILLSVASCKEDEPVNVFTGYSYFPDNIGHELIYDVDSIVKDDFTNETDTLHFQVMEVIDSVITDLEGRVTLRLERYKRLTSADPWVIYKVWTANKTLSNAEKKEDNITYIKLVLPPEINDTWDGNKKNNIGEEIYEYTSLNNPDYINSLSFDSTLTVLQSDEDDGIITKDYKIEKYAASVGMYYKESFIGEYKQDLLPHPTLIDSLKRYTHYTERLISFNN